MRRALFAIVLAACTPEIAPGTYLCGPEQLCPEGQACNAPDNVCVFESQAQPFSCDPDLDPPGDDTPATAISVGTLACVSPARELIGCMGEGDRADWHELDVPAACTAVQIEATLAFPIAFEELGLQLSSDGGAGTAVEMPCGTSRAPVEGETLRCFEMTVTPGGRYAIGVVAEGTGTCDGACAFNRYRLRVQLATP
ncbi:MAG: hypothetical protein M3680_21305 [Myxococcota bacterium]|nr:hypothetical protein [Myxococcota bacterium]